MENFPKVEGHKPAACGFSFVWCQLCIWATCLQIAYKQQARKNFTTKLIAWFLMLVRAYLVARTESNHRHKDFQSSEMSNGINVSIEIGIYKKPFFS